MSVVFVAVASAFFLFSCTDSISERAEVTSECSSPVPLEQKPAHFSGYIIAFDEAGNWTAEKTKKRAEKLAERHQFEVEQTYDHMIDGFRARLSNDALATVRCAPQVQRIVGGRRRSPRDLPTHDHRGIGVTGTYSDAAVEAIIRRVKQETSEPILSVGSPQKAAMDYRIRERDSLPTDTVKVTTGVIKGWLNGSGSFYQLAKGENGWRIISKKGWIS